MNEFLKMDIFFGVTTVAVIVLTVLLVIVLIRVISILRNIDELVLLAKEEGAHIRKDLDEMRTKVRDGGMRIGHLFGFLGGMREKKTRPRASRRS